MLFCHYFVLHCFFNKSFVRFNKNLKLRLTIEKSTKSLEIFTETLRID